MGQQRVVLQGGRATGNQAKRNLPGKQNEFADQIVPEYASEGEGAPETDRSGSG